MFIKIPLFVLTLLVSFSVTAAEKPSFDCKKAEGEVERLICKEASLAALDGKLHEVFKAALAKANGKSAKQLRAEQRGWVKGRNDCWKANGSQTWITASWTVDSVQGCVEAQYRLRIAELQSVWRLLPARTMTYACQNNPANELVANFFASDPATIRLERGDRSVTLWRVEAANDNLYEGQNVSLLHKDNEVTVNWLHTDTVNTELLQCKIK